MSAATRSAPTRHVDHLVIGGGPAGSMVALRLAAAGRQVLLLEKESLPHHKVCGEFLSHEAVSYLHQVGVAPRNLGAAVIHHLRFTAGSKLIATPLPFQALSLSRLVLDEALLARAEAKGCQVLRGVAVESLTPRGSDPHDGDWLATLATGESLRASTVFLATGKHNLRGIVRAPAKQSDLIGFKLHWQLAPTQILALREHMDLYLFPGGYGGLSLVEDDVANLCLVVRRSTLRSRGGWPQLLASILRGNCHLRQLLEGGTALWPRPIAISPIPYGYLLGQPPRGLWCVGDQAAVIPSFTGDGISIALHSAALATHMFLCGASAADYNRSLRAQLTRSMALATWLSRAAVTGAGRRAALSVLPRLPNLLCWIAASTRIPQSSLVPDEFAPDGAGPAARQSA
jgi:flavin-dependent dehydrogenase